MGNESICGAWMHAYIHEREGKAIEGVRKSVFSHK
jgi:hypothetical protein